MSDSLWPHGLQHARPPCPSPIPGVYPNSCPLNQWCHPTISSSVLSFSSHLQSFPASGTFQMSQFFALGGQSIGDSVSTSVLPMNTQDWSLLNGLVGSPCSPRDSQESSPTPKFKSINFLVLSFLYGPTQSPAIATTIDGKMVTPGETQDMKIGYCPQIRDVHIKGMILTLASSHTQKSAQFHNLGYLVVFNNNLLMFGQPALCCKTSI